MTEPVAGERARELADKATESILQLLREYQAYKPGPLGPYRPALSGEIYARVAGALAAVRLEARQQMAMLAADECDGAQVERPSKTLNAAEFNRWITDVGDKIRALGGANDDWWEKSLAKARLEEARWWHKNLIDPWTFNDSKVGCGAIKRLAELERAAGGERAVEGK